MRWKLNVRHADVHRLFSTGDGTAYRYRREGRQRTLNVKRSTFNSQPSTISQQPSTKWRPLPARVLYGVGRVTEQVLLGAGIRTVGDLQDYSGDLRALVGSFGPKLKQYALGEDAPPLSSRRMNVQRETLNLQRSSSDHQPSANSHQPAGP